MYIFCLIFNNEWKVHFSDAFALLKRCKILTLMEKDGVCSSALRLFPSARSLFRRSLLDWMLLYYLSYSKLQSHTALAFLFQSCLLCDACLFSFFVVIFLFFLWKNRRFRSGKIKCESEVRGRGGRAVFWRRRIIKLTRSRWLEKEAPYSS